ncbi:hypothetical protein HLP44_000713 [Shigella sonnei]|nr:hypothetical protein [Shigella sonnei]
MNYCPHPDKKSELKFILESSRQWIKTARLTDMAFANEHLVPALESFGLIDDTPETGDEWMKVRNKYAKRVTRILAGESPLPYYWREAWLSSLPSSVSSGILRYSARAHGYMLVSLPTLNADGSFDATLDVLAGGFADVMSNAGPAFDGSYGTEDDHSQLIQLEQALMSLKESVAAEIERVRAGLSLHNKELS